MPFYSPEFILKIISVPATQAQLDALLLAGAYKDPADAMDYYRGISEDIMAEAELLKRLSKLDGFLAYEGWQMECCGKDFEINSTVKWPVCNGNNIKLPIKIKKIDYLSFFCYNFSRIGDWL